MEKPLSEKSVGAEAHIGPLGNYEFAADYRKNGAFCRADVGIGPYKQPLYSICFSWYSWFSASMGVSVSTVMASSARRSSSDCMSSIET